MDSERAIRKIHIDVEELHVALFESLLLLLLILLV